MTDQERTAMRETIRRVLKDRDDRNLFDRNDREIVVDALVRELDLFIGLDFGKPARLVEQRKKQRKLGKIQKQVLDSLRNHGFWSRHCGWIWDTTEHTKKLMESLVRAGVATFDGTVYRPVKP